MSGETYYVVNARDLANLTRNLSANYRGTIPLEEWLAGPPAGTLFGVPVVENDAVPPGTILKITTQPPAIERPFAPAFDADPILFYRMNDGFGMLGAAARHSAFVLLEFGEFGRSAYDRLCPERTKAQERRRVKRFVRDCIAARRLGLEMDWEL